MKKLKFIGMLLGASLTILSCETESISNVETIESNNNADESSVNELINSLDVNSRSSVRLNTVRDLSQVFGTFTVTKRRSSAEGDVSITSFDPDALFTPVRGSQENNFAISNTVSIDGDGIETANNNTVTGVATVSQLSRIIFNANENNAAAARLVFRISDDANIIDIFNISERFAFRFERNTNFQTDVDELIASLDANNRSSVRLRTVRNLSEVFGTYRVTTRRSNAEGDINITSYDPDALFTPPSGAQGNNFGTSNRIRIDSNGLRLLNNNNSRGNASVSAFFGVLFNANANNDTPGRLVFRISEDNNIIDIFNIDERFAFRFERS